MKTVFWSPVVGQAGSTSLAACTSILLAWQFKKKIMLLNTCQKSHALERCFLPVKSDNNDVFDNVGMDVLLRNLRLRNTDKRYLEDAAITFYSNNLHIITGTMKENKEQYEEDMVSLFPQSIDITSNWIEIAMIDAPTGLSRVSKMIVDQADLLVINLPQNKTIIDDYFKNYYLLNKKKTLFIIGNYDSSSCYNLKNLTKMYKPFKDNVITCIPYNVQFKDAISNSSVISFMQKNIDASEENKKFIDAIKNVSNQIIKEREELINARKVF
jgi:hypothetical protein